jgi:hypothetical protein
MTMALTARRGAHVQWLTHVITTIEKINWSPAAGQKYKPLPRNP